MFLGHYALALGAKRTVPSTSLGLLTAAAQLPDLLWPVFLLLGWERVAPGDRGFTALSFTHYPWSHSLLLVVIWGTVAAALVVARARGARVAWVVAFLVVSHWVLDYVTHRPDLPLYPGGGPRLGLGLWNSPVATTFVEGALWIAGLAVYLRTTRAVDRAGSAGFWALVALLMAVYATNYTGAAPADTRAVAWGALAGWLVPVWAAWSDRHRRVGHRGGSRAPTA